MIKTMSFQQAKKVKPKGKVLSIAQKAPKWARTALQSPKPRWKIIMDFRKGKISFAEYREKYLKDLDVKKLINEVEAAHTRYKDITLCCWCKLPALCHRSIVAKVLQDNGMEVQEW